MSISSTTVVNSYSGDGADTTFNFTFPVLAKGDLVVEIKVDSTGVYTTQTITTHYTISGTGNDTGRTNYTSGTVTFVTAPASGETIVVSRMPTVTQTVDYVENDTFPAETHEEALDRLTLINQDIKSIANRGIHIGSDLEATVNTRITPEGSKFLAWSADGLSLKNEGSTITDEALQDVVGAMFSGNTETGIAATYQDSDGTIDLAVDHDAAANYVANEHIDHTSVTLIAGNGLGGGGDISANRTFTLDFNSLTTETSIASGDFLGMVDITDGASGKITFANLESAISHANITGAVANEHIDHTSVTLTAGVGLSGGGNIAANRTFTIDLNELTTETSISAGDFIAMVDISDSGSGKITFANLESGLNHQNLSGIVANQHINWTSTSSNFSTSGTAATGALTVTGNITVTGTVDGRDIAADGATLDGLTVTDQDIQDQAYTFAADAQGNDSYAITLSPSPGSYATGQVFYFTANTINTGACTLNVNSIGAKSIVKRGGSTLANGDIQANQLICVAYDGTNFQMLNQLGNAPGGSGDMVLADVQTVTGQKTFSDTRLRLAGSTSGNTIIKATAVAGTTTITFPAATDTVVCRSTTDTITNKTLDLGNNTLTGAASEFDAALQSNTFVFTSEVGSVVQAYDADTAKTDVAQEYTATQNFNATTLTDATTVSWNSSANQVCKVTLGGNRTMAAPTNLKDGATYILHVLQDGTGSRTLTWNSVFKWPGGTAPVLSTAASSRDIVSFVSDGTNLYGVASLLFS